jgi:hypothetical protein
MYLITFILFTQIFYQFSNAQYLTLKLTENEVRAVIPILKAEITGYGQFEDAQKADYLARKKLMEEIKSGKVDPLDWLKQHSKYVIIPPEVIYEPGVSRAFSIRGWDLPDDPEVPDRAFVHPIAIFTFGKELPAMNKHLLGKTITNESFNAFTQNPWNGDDPSFQEIWNIMKKMDSFYSRNGFSVTNSEDGFSLILHPHDTEDEITGSVDPIIFDIYNPLYQDLVKNSRSHPMGPSIAIMATYKLMDRVFKPIDIKLGTDNSKVKENLQKAGITEDRYGELKGALLMAREGSRGPEEEEPTLDFTPSTPEEKELAKEVEKMREEVRIKRKNIELYKKYKEELDPILEVLEQHMGGKY